MQQNYNFVAKSKREKLKDYIGELCSRKIL